MSWFRIVGCALLLVCPPVTKGIVSTGDLRIFSDEHCDCLRAEFTWRSNTTVLLESYTGGDGGEGRLVSRVALVKTQGQKRTQEAAPMTLSALEIPVKNIHDLVINGISKLVTSAAQNMTRTIGKSGTLNLTDLVVMYDAMFDKLHRNTRGWPFKHARWAMFYHYSAVHAAQRISEGIAAPDACPPYQGYASGKTGGLFVCRQEYERTFLLSQRQKVSEDRKQLMMRINEQKKEGVNFEDLVEDVARLIACGSPSCNVPGCSGYQYDLGWHIFGSDDGCCGDYLLCCGFADPICFFHDLLCECCAYFVCPEPLCKPAPTCRNTTVVG